MSQNRLNSKEVFNFIELLKRITNAALLRRNLKELVTLKSDLTHLNLIQLLSDNNYVLSSGLLNQLKRIDQYDASESCIAYAKKEIYNLCNQIENEIILQKKSLFSAKLLPVEKAWNECVKSIIEELHKEFGNEAHAIFVKFANNINQKKQFLNLFNPMDQVKEKTARKLIYGIIGAETYWNLSNFNDQLGYKYPLLENMLEMAEQYYSKKAGLPRPQKARARTRNDT